MLRRRLTYANVMATIAVVIAVGGSSTAIAAVIITNNNQVAQNTISGHAPPAGVHANLISGSVNGTDLSGAYKKSVKVKCPNGMFLGGGLCIEPTPRAATDYVTAMNTCALANLRLPGPGEMALVYNNIGAPSGTNTFSVWAGDPFYLSGSGVYAAMLLEENSSRQITLNSNPIDDSRAYYCVSSPTN
jgi:hypothetical protein